MPSKRSTSVALGVIAASALACSSPTMGCNPNLPTYAHNISITVVDSATGRPIADSATGRVASAGLTDSLWHDQYYPDSVLYSPVAPDTYAAAIVRPGYQQWLKSGIVVTASGSCGAVTPVNLTARLQPMP